MLPMTPTDVTVTPARTHTGQGARRGYYVYVTEACNLRCSYCFVKEKQNGRHLTTTMAKHILEFISEDASSLSSIYVHFFGGEPLLRPMMVDYLAGRLREWSSGRQLDLRLGLTTNGTLLTTENCEMLKRHGIGVQLSLDGSKEGNDIHRQFMGGTQCGLRAAGAFDSVNIASYLSHFGRTTPNCRMTLTVQNLPYLGQSISELHKLGFKSFSIIPDFDTGSWTLAHIGKYEHAMEAVLQYWAKNQELWINCFDKTARALRNKRLPRSLCQAGTDILGITVDGDLYPCHDFSGRYSRGADAKKLLIGHVTTGYSESHRRPIDMSIESSVKSGCGYDCGTCWAKWTCARGCPYMNYASSGDIRIVNATYCATQRVNTLLMLKWMCAAGQIDVSRSSNSRTNPMDGRMRPIMVQRNDIATVAGGPTEDRQPVEISVS